MPVRRLNKRRKTYKSKKRCTKRVKRTRKRKTHRGGGFFKKSSPKAERDMGKSTKKTNTKTITPSKVKRGPSSFGTARQSHGAQQELWRLGFQ